MLAEARRPILYTGGGIINSGPGASHLLRELARLTGAPVTSTLMGLGAFPSSDPQWLGMLGMHGTYERSEEHTSELQSLMRISYAVFCLKKKKYHNECAYRLPTVDSKKQSKNNTHKSTHS